MSLTYVEDIETKVKPRIQKPEESLSMTLNQPFVNTTSGSRKVLNNIQYQHAMNMVYAEPSTIVTGHEDRFGEVSSSVITACGEYTCVAKIERYSEYPGMEYLLIFHEPVNNLLISVKRVPYHYNTQSFGYLYNNNVLDSIEVGDTIDSGTVLRTSMVIDDLGCRRDGANFVVLYCACGQTTEDGIIISESAAKKFSIANVDEVELRYNANTAPLNLYGDDDEYKIMPDIGETVKKGKLAANRIEDRKNMLYTMSQERLKKTLMSDTKYLIETGAMVVDIDVCCNDESILKENPYYAQLYKYHLDKKRFCKEVVDTFEQLIVDYDICMDDVDYQLQELYDDSDKFLKGIQHIDKKIYNNTKVKVHTINITPAKVGDKITDRFGETNQ